MSGFRTGRFNIDDIPGYLRPFAPVEAVDSILDVDPKALAASGKKLLLLDLDNTLVVWRGSEISPEVAAWIETARAAGLHLCLLSNTRNVARLRELSERLGVQFSIGKFKPSRYMYRKAMAEFHAKASETLMIGDQLFTDVFGANRTGIEAIWVRQIAPKDLATTKISRFGERVVRRGLYRGLEYSERETEMPMGGGGALELAQVPIVRQFIKFCIVGGSSTVIDKGLLWVLMYHVYLPSGGLLSQAIGNSIIQVGLGISKTPHDAAVPVINVLTAGLAILNSFIWNRRWTFKIRGKEQRGEQLRKFFIVALIGLGLNLVITSGIVVAYQGDRQRGLFIASVVATIMVAFWNFLGQKLWTFRRR